MGRSHGDHAGTHPASLVVPRVGTPGSQPPCTSVITTHSCFRGGSGHTQDAQLPFLGTTPPCFIPVLINPTSPGETEAGGV